MDATYRTLAAALELEEFTITALAEEADVKPTTVRTVLGRNRTYFDTEAANSRRRGGQPQIWTVREDSREALLAKVKEIDDRFTDQTDSGLRFGPGGELVSPAISRLRAAAQQPELVTADDLNRGLLLPLIDLLPKTIQRLLLRTEGLTSLSIRTGEGIFLPSFDVRVEAAESSPFVPAGASVWEIGSSEDPLAKANKDVKSRTANSEGVEPRETTFVFVTPRRFVGKEDWIERRSRKGPWLAYRVIDADDLYSWLVGTPTVHIWLSEQAGLHPEAVATVEAWFASWCDQTLPALTGRVILAGRESEAERLRAGARLAGQVVSVASNSREESRAFIAAALLENVREHDLAGEADRFTSTLLVKHDWEWAKLVNSLSDGVLIPEFGDPDVAAATSRGLTVLLPMGLGDPRRDETIALQRIDPLAATEVLTAAGLERNEAGRSAEAVDRSLTSFRRSHAVSPIYERPRWARDDAARLVSSLTVVGGWDVRSLADREVVARIVGRDYEDIDAVLQNLALHDDPPLFMSGSGWQLSSPEDAFALVEGALTKAVLDRWLDAAVEVLSQGPRPALVIPTKDELIASAKGIRAYHSSALRSSLVRGAALLGVSRGTLPGADPLSRYADELVRRLLFDEAGPTVWSGLTRELPMLAEAAPEVVLDAVEDGVSGDRPLLAPLFEERVDAPLLGGTPPGTGLLWALELLCQAPEHAARACNALAKLVELESPNLRGASAFDSLRRMLLPWHPQVALERGQRDAVVEAIVERHPAVGWRLLLGLLPSLFDSTHPAPSAAFRPWRATEQSLTGERLAAWTSLTELAIRVATSDPAKMLQLVETVQTMRPESRERVFAELAAIDVSGLPESTRRNGWDALSNFVAKHRQFPDAKWALPDGELRVLEGVVEAWAPVDPIHRYASLFVGYPSIPFPKKIGDHDEYDERVQVLRRDALTVIVPGTSVASVVQVIEAGGDPATIGTVIADERGEAVTAEMLEWLGEDDPRNTVARSWLFRMVHLRGEEWRSVVLAEIGTFSDWTRLSAYLTVPFADEVLDHLPDEPPEIQERFWQGAQRWLFRSDRVADIANGLLDHGLARAALSYLAIKVKTTTVPEDLVLRSLRDVSEVSSTDSGIDSMLAYEVGELLDHLKARGLAKETLAGLEWSYLWVLEGTREPSALFVELADHPELFVELVSRVFRAANEEPIEDDTTERDPQLVARAQMSYSLLRSWRTLPGTSTSGEIDSAVLRSWVQQARQLLAEADRTDIGDECIGQLLAGSPPGEDGFWPAEPIRDLLEELPGKHLRAGIEIGRFNARGVTTKGMFDGGDQERALVAQYEESSRRLAPRWPNTARILRDLSKTYGQWATQEDARDEQWRDER